MISAIFGGCGGITVATAIFIIGMVSAANAWDVKPLRWMTAGAIVLTVIFWGIAYATAAPRLALGDSIALGTGHALGVPTIARQGAGSCEIANWVPAQYYDKVVISAGINDGGACVAKLRAKVHAGMVVQVLPAPINAGYAAVVAVARQYGDRTVTYACRGGCTKRNFHPASYKVLARWVRNQWGDSPQNGARSAKRRASTGR